MESKNDTKRLYSRNAIAYVIATTNLIPQFFKDEESEFIYAVFPECAAVDASVRAYKRGDGCVIIRDFLRAFELIKNTIYNFQHPEGGEEHASTT